jgi:hypothetical protein
MKERLFTLACAIGALILFVGMFLRREGGLDPRNDIPRPITTERRGNGYNAAFTWLEGEKVRVISLRDRFDKLGEVQALAPTGNLLIVTLPAAGSFNTEEFVPLDTWIRAGNTLLVLAALCDAPDWSYRSAGVAIGDLNLLTGLEFETVRNREERLKKRTTRNEPQPDQKKSDADEPADEEEKATIAESWRPFAKPQQVVMLPNRSHAYFGGVREVIALSDYSQLSWTVKVPYEGFVLSLARQRDTGEGVLWTRALGAGRIVVSGLGSIFTNRALGLGDNGQFLSNFIAANLGARGSVLFDDAHQGLGAAYDPEKFYKDKRLYVTVGVLMGLWLIWVLGSTRLRVPSTRATAPREVELVLATGGFFARVLPTHAAADRLLEHFFRRVNERLQRPETGPPWDLLERHPRVAAADLERLKGYYAEVRAERRVPLGRLYNLILRIDGNIA